MRTIALVVLIAGACPVSGSDAHVYVSPSGDDGDLGTAVRPVRSASAARDRLRARRATGEKPPVGG